MNVELVEILKIKIPSWHRPVNPNLVKDMSDKIKEEGLINPITLVQTENELLLAAGQHRLKAVEIFSESIEANIRQGDELLAEIISIDENLLREELTALQESTMLARRKVLYEQKYPSTRQGGDRRSEEFSNSNNDDLKPFTEVIADVTGQSKSTVQKKLEIGEKLPETVKTLLEGSPIEDNRAELKRLVDLKDEELQQEVAEAIFKGQADSVEDALEVLGHEAPNPVKVTSSDIARWKKAIKKMYEGLSTLKDLSPKAKSMFEAPELREQREEISGIMDDINTVFISLGN